MTNCRIKPTRDQLLVEPVKAAAHVGRIVVPEAHREEKPQEAVVVAVGPRNELPVKVGDRVVINRYEGQQVLHGETMMKLMKPVDVLAVVGEGLDLVG